MPDHNCPTQPDASAHAGSKNREWQRARAEQLEDDINASRNALLDLMAAGTRIAQAAAAHADLDVMRDTNDPYANSGFKGGVHAAKAFALTSQGVRRCILLLQKVNDCGWWEQSVSPAANRRAERRFALAAGPADEAAEAVDRLDRLERAETLEDAFGAGFGARDAARAVAAVRGELAHGAELAGMMMPDVPRADAYAAGVDRDGLLEDDAPDRDPPD